MRGGIGMKTSREGDEVRAQGIIYVVCGVCVGLSTMCVCVCLLLSVCLFALFVCFRMSWNVKECV